jgi:hypothetical protein
MGNGHRVSSASDEDKCAISRIGSFSTNSVSWEKQNVIVLNKVIFRLLQIKSSGLSPPLCFMEIVVGGG